MTTLLDRSGIEEILPHRSPFLFVHEVLEIEPGQRIVGLVRVGEDETFLARDAMGSYLPPTVLAEAMAQVGAILVLYPEDNRGRAIYFRSIDETEFFTRIGVGVELRVEAHVKRMRSRLGTLEVNATRDGVLAAKGVMSFALGNLPNSSPG